MLVNDNEDADFRPAIIEAKNKGFNAVYLTVRWDVVKCKNGECVDGNGNINQNWGPGSWYWTQVDQQIAKATELGMKVALRIHLSSADLNTSWQPRQRSKYLWGDDNYMRKQDGSADLGGFYWKMFSYAEPQAIDSARNFVEAVMNRYSYLENQSKLLFVSITTGTSQELEYSHHAALDYSDAMKQAYNSWHQSEYGTGYQNGYPNNPSTDWTSEAGKRWYHFRHKAMKDFVGVMRTAIKSANSNIKVINDHGSVSDGMSRDRGTLAFKSLGENMDGIKVNDDYTYDHRFSMDLLRSNFPGKWIMNELLTDGSHSDQTIYDFIAQSFDHGAKLFAFVTGAPERISQYQNVFSQISSQYLSGSPNVNSNGTVSYTFAEALNANFNYNRPSTTSRNIYNEWLTQYNNNPSNAKPVNLIFDDNELNDNCTTPSAPSLSASSTTITSGSSVTLSASGCSGGTITWSNNLGTGNSKTVSPTSTTTYTATCSIGGCTSPVASITITVTPQTGGGGSCVVNKVRLKFRTTSDPHGYRLQGAKIQGYSNNSWTDLYTITTDGTGNWQEFTFSNTTSFDKVRYQSGPDGWGELTELQFYNGSTRLHGDTSGQHGDWQYAFDGNESSTWYSGTKGTSNVAEMVLSSCGSSECSGTGSITYQRWNNIGGGTSISDLQSGSNNYQNTPSVTSSLTLFQAPADVSDNYGARIIGYICPPQTGNYTFWVAGDDNVELWLSTSDNPSNKVKIAYHTSWTNTNEWTKFTTQESGLISLVAGQRYYVEALMKEGGGGDNLSVGWRLPDNSLNRPISGSYLIPWDGGSNTNSLTVSTETISNIAAAGGSQSINVTSNVSWTVSASTSWITVSPTSGSNNGSITITIASNSGSSRSGNVTVSGGGITRTIEISQQASTSSNGGCVVNKVRLIFRSPNDSHLDRLIGAKIQGSNDGVTWVELYTYTSNGTGSWQENTFSNTTAYNRARFVAGPNGYGELHELEFYNGSTKLSGTTFGTDDYNDVFDGNTASQWHGSTVGSVNYAGLILSGCITYNCGTLEGHFDDANCSILSGWVYDYSNPNTVLTVDLYDGSTLVQSNITAGNFRQDLLDAGKGNGYHGFNISTPSTLKNGTTRNLTIKVSGCNYSLINSPKSINCGSNAVVEPEAEDSRSSTDLKVWQNPNRGSFDITFYLERGKRGNITVTDLTGIRVYNRQITGMGYHRERVTLNHTASGTFILLLKTDSKTAAQKVLINR